MLCVFSWFILVTALISCGSSNKIRNLLVSAASLLTQILLQDGERKGKEKGKGGAQEAESDDILQIIQENRNKKPTSPVN